MTDMHREEFERWFDGEYGMDFTIGEYRKAYESWLAALRYRDEQKQCECAYTCKFCRDEQEKGDGEG